MFRLDKKIENRLSLILVVAFALIMTTTLIYLNSTHYILGHSYRDVFFYLIQSLRFSGVNITGYAYVNYLSPFIPFLTSLLFRMGFVSQTSIFITSGVFFFFGILGMFYILKLKFNNFYSLFGAFIYGTLLINIRWVGNGTLDIAFISVLLWALYFFIMGMEKNQKYFYIAFPLAVISFFTKYPAALLVPLMILYFMSKTNFTQNFKKYFKNLFGGIVAGVITSIPFFAYFFLNNIPLGFLNQAEEVSSKTSLSASHGGQLIQNDLFFYIKGLIYDISSSDYFVGVIILAITIIGFIILIYILTKVLKDSYAPLSHSKALLFKWCVSFKLMYVILILSVVLVLVSFFTASLFSFVYSEIILFLGLYLFAYSLTKIILSYSGVSTIKSSSFPNISFNITMIGLFLVYLVFFSSHLTKADRYFTSMAPGFIFLITLSLEALISKITGFNIKGINVKHIIPIFIMILMLFASVHFITGIGDDSLAVGEKNAALWIGDEEGVIMSDRAPIYTWLFQKEVPYAINSYNGTLLNEELLNENAKYYISSVDVNLTDYGLVKEFGDVRIYAKS